MRLRTMFDHVPEVYDRARPGYPAPLVHDLVALTGIGTGSPVLEIGPGTGQLTVPLARLGCRITAVELGARLAAVARRNLAAFPDAEVIVADFDEWALPDEPFAAVVSATAFHWLDPTTRAHKAADALRAGGWLATVATRHIIGGTTAFFDDEQACYERWYPAARVGFRLPTAGEVPSDGAELLTSGRFASVVFRRYEGDVEYTTAAYIDRLLTYAGTLALDAASRKALLQNIVSLIDARYDGKVTKRYLYELRVARRF